MSAALEAPTLPRLAPPEPAAAGGTTLAARLDAVIEAVHAEGAAVCPVCTGTIERAPTGARCRDCGSRVR